MGFCAGEVHGRSTRSNSPFSSISPPTLVGAIGISSKYVPIDFRTSTTVPPRKKGRTDDGEVDDISREVVDLSTLTEAQFDLAVSGVHIFQLPVDSNSSVSASGDEFQVKLNEYVEKNFPGSMFSSVVEDTNYPLAELHEMDNFFTCISGENKKPSASDEFFVNVCQVVSTTCIELEFFPTSRNVMTIFSQCCSDAVDGVKLTRAAMSIPPANQPAHVTLHQGDTVIVPELLFHRFYVSPSSTPLWRPKSYQSSLHIYGSSVVCWGSQPKLHSDRLFYSILSVALRVLKEVRMKIFKTGFFIILFGRWSRLYFSSVSSLEVLLMVC